MIKTTTLPNGLRIVTDNVNSVGTVSLGIWACVGSRYESSANNGVAHMVEHMIFKGTKTRNAKDIAEQIENVGGHMNAYTGREITGYYMHIMKDDVNLATDILTDMVQNPLFSQEDFDKERQVVLQEIGMYEDTPDDLIFDNYQQTAYKNQAIGAPILGTTEIIRNMPREELFNYADRSYTPCSLVVSAAGNINHDEFVSLISDRMGNIRKNKEISYDAANYTSGESRVEKDLEQAHIIMGFKGVSRKDDDYYAAIALSTILGGGMSSRLFQQIREERGLVYSIYSYHNAFQDDGQFGIYAGTGANDLKELVAVTCDEIIKVTNDISEEELARAKAQLKSNLLMSRESMTSRADQQAKHMIFHNKVMDINEKIAKINDLDIFKIQEIGKKIFSSKLTIAAIGPISALEGYDQISSRIAI